MKDELQKLLSEHQEEYIRAAQKIHELAELSSEETESAKVLETLLEKHGFRVECGLKNLPTAFRAAKGNGALHVGFMCEYDALAGLQQDDVPYLKGNGTPGHGCGHDLLGVGSAAAAIALSELAEKNSLDLTVIVYGTPAEETLQGKAIMVQNGYFRDLDVCLAWHPLDHNNPGEVQFKAATAFYISFEGVAAHACNCPEKGRSALDAAELTNIGVNYLREHITRDCYMHYVYTDAGRRPNIVPDTAQLWYMVRANHYDDMVELKNRVMRVAQGAAMMTDTKVSFETLGESHHSLLNFTLAQLAYDCMKEIGAPKFHDEEKAYAKEVAKNIESKQARGEFDEGLMVPDGTTKYDNGSSDVADVSHVVPVININTACYARNTPNHTWAVTVQCTKSAAYKGMMFAAAVLALMGAKLCKDDTLMQKVKKEFEEGGRQ